MIGPTNALTHASALLGSIPYKRGTGEINLRHVSDSTVLRACRLGLVFPVGLGGPPLHRLHHGVPDGLIERVGHVLHAAVAPARDGPLEPLRVAQSFAHLVCLELDTDDGAEVGSTHAEPKDSVDAACGRQDVTLAVPRIWPDIRGDTDHVHHDSVLIRLLERVERALVPKQRHDAAVETGTGDLPPCLLPLTFVAASRPIEELDTVTQRAARGGVQHQDDVVRHLVLPARPLIEFVALCQIETTIDPAPMGLRSEDVHPTLPREASRHLELELEFGDLIVREETRVESCPTMLTVVETDHRRLILSHQNPVVERPFSDQRTQHRVEPGGRLVSHRLGDSQDVPLVDLPLNARPLREAIHATHGNQHRSLDVEDVDLHPPLLHYLDICDFLLHDL
jgi:hypothetical protein